MYAEIIIPLALPKNYTWTVPDNLIRGLKPGCRVEVTLRNKKYAGVVKRLHEEKPAAFDPRPIGDVLDTDPLVNPEQLQLWEWLSTYYMCSEGEVMAAALPAHFKLSSESILVYQETYGDDFSSLDNDEFRIAERLLEKKELRLSDAQTLLGAVPAYPVVKRLIDKGVCYVWESLKEVYKPRLERFITLHPDYQKEENLEKLLNDEKYWGRAGKQMELLLAYLHLEKTDHEVTAPGLIKKSGASDAQLRGLIQKGILVADQRPVDRL